MSDEVVARILSIELDEENDAYVVEFWVGQELSDTPTLNEAFALLSHLDSLQREVYTFSVQWDGEDITMEPDEALSECLLIFDQYDSADELGSAVARQWKTGQMAEALVTQLVKANVFGVWRTYEPPDEEEGEEATGQEASESESESDSEAEALRTGAPRSDAATPPDEPGDDTSGNGALDGSD